MQIGWFAAICCILLLGPAAAQFGGFGGPAGGDPVPAVKSDLPYIRCGACEALAKNAYRQIKALKDAQKPGKKVTRPSLNDVLRVVLAQAARDNQASRLVPCYTHMI